MGVFDADGQPLFQHCCSAPDVQQRYQADSLFRIYSMTKPITTVALLLCLERGLVKLDDPLSSFIPAFQHMQVQVNGTAEPVEEPIRIIHLLTHTSGISYGIFGDNASDRGIKQAVGAESCKNWFRDLDLSTLCDRIAQAPLAFLPGRHFHYGLNTDVLGRVVEVASGKKLDEFFAEEIFGPLGMTETFFTVPCEQVHRLVDVYEVAVGKGRRPSLSSERDRLQAPALLAGGGGLVSSLADYARFATFLLNKGALGGVRLLEEHTVELMTRNQLPDGREIAEISFEGGFSEAIGPGFGFGLGVSVVTDPKQVKGGSLSNRGEYGWGGVSNTFFSVDPMRKVSLIFMTQLIPSSEYPVRAQMRWLTYHTLDSIAEEEGKV